MAIEENNYVKYNSEEHFYYLTEAGMVYYTGYDILSQMWGEYTEINLIKMGRQLHRLITSSGYNGKRQRYRHIDLIEYKIFKNEYGERQAIIDALVMMIEIDYDDDWFRKLLAGEVDFPKSITQPLQNAGVYFRGEIIGIVPEEEYRVGY